MSSVLNYYAVAQSPWITVNSNRFCCDHYSNKTSATTAPEKVKFSSDIDSEAARNKAGTLPYVEKLDIYGYRDDKCQVRSICAHYPPERYYTSLCPNLAATDDPFLSVNPGFERERCRIFSEHKPNVAETLTKARVMNLNEYTGE